MKMKIKKGDTVKILSGKDRGKTGKVLHSFPALGKILVEGVHIVKKHQKPRARGKHGQMIEKPLPIFASSAALIDPKSGTPTRIGYKQVGEKKVRISKKSGMEI